MNRWLSASLLLICSNSPVLASEDLLGQWRGTFYCNRTLDLKLTLSINESNNGQLKGVFEYSAGLKGRASYNVTGTVTPTGSFQITPGSWIMHPTGFRAVSLHGQVGQSGSKRVIDGRLPECDPGGFRAFLLPPAEALPPPLAMPSDTDGQIKEVRDRLRKYMQTRESGQISWNRLERAADAIRVDRQIRDLLLAEIREGQANVKADAIIAELASGTTRFPTGMGKAIRAYDRANKSDWPNEVKLRIYEACKKRLDEVFRPVLTKVGASAASLPNNLDGLALARAALAPVEAYRAFLEHAFGSLDPENLLAPMWQKIAELESNPAIAAEFREAFAEARRQPDPRAATENVIRNVLGDRSKSAALIAIAAEGRRQAALAEVVVMRTTGAEDGSEPTANDMALHMQSVIEALNATFAAGRCNPGDKLTVFDMTRCELGELEVRLKKVIKTKCVAEAQGEQYVCNFDQHSIVVSFRTGELVTGHTGVAGNFPGGRMEGPQKARFVRRAFGGWDSSSLNPG